MLKNCMVFLLVGVSGAQASESWQSAFVRNLKKINAAQAQVGQQREERAVKAFEQSLQEKIKAEQAAATPKPTIFTEQDPCYQAAFPTFVQAAHKKSNSKKA